MFTLHYRSGLASLLFYLAAFGVGFAVADASAELREVITPGTIVGRVVFEGKAPKMRPLPVESDPHCVRLRDGKPLLTEMLILGEGQTMANVIVSVVSNLPELEHPVPAEAVTLSQKGCQYEPHVFALRAGQKIEVLNPDGINHNVHLMPVENKEMNRAMANANAKFTYEVTKAEEPFTIKCDVHSWMKAYCGVFDHPYFAVTGPDGRFKIEGLPPGTYEIETWHEIGGLGKRRATVTLFEGRGGEVVNFTYSRPKR